jgi:hypothetical protein
MTSDVAEKHSADPDSRIAFSRRFGACRSWRSLLG